MRDLVFDLNGGHCYSPKPMGEACRGSRWTTEHEWGHNHKNEVWDSKRACLSSEFPISILEMHFWWALHWDILSSPRTTASSSRRGNKLKKQVHTSTVIPQTHRQGLQVQMAWKRMLCSAMKRLGQSAAVAWPRLLLGASTIPTPFAGPPGLGLHN